jgi:hypothetical protein
MDNDTTTDTREAPPRRNRLVITMMAASVLLLVVAGVAVVLGRQAQSETDQRHDQTAAAIASGRTLARQKLDFEEARRDLERQAHALPGQYRTVAGTFDGLGTAHDNFVDVLNHAAGLYNAGDIAGARSVLQNDGPPALANLQAKKAEAQQAVRSAEDALHQLQEGL